MEIRPLESFNFVIVTTYRCILLIFTSFALVLNSHATIIQDNAPEAPDAKKALSENTPLKINIKECRLANYAMKFDLLRSNSNVGDATRTLIEANADNNTQLESSFTASMAFVKFTQKEHSTVKKYKEMGLYSSEYTKFTKKPFKREDKQTYPVNALLANNNALLFDPLSVYEHLRELVCSGLRSNLTLDVQEENEVTQYYFEFKGEQRIQIPMGQAQTLLFVRTRKTSTRETSIYFDKKHHFLPVKIQQEKDGDSQAVLVAKSISYALFE